MENTVAPNGDSKNQKNTKASSSIENKVRKPMEMKVESIVEDELNKRIQAFTDDGNTLYVGCNVFAPTVQHQASIVNVAEEHVATTADTKIEYSEEPIIHSLMYVEQSRMSLPLHGAKTIQKSKVVKHKVPQSKSTSVKTSQTKVASTRTSQGKPVQHKKPVEKPTNPNDHSRG